MLKWYDFNNHTSSLGISGTKLNKALTTDCLQLCISSSGQRGMISKSQSLGCIYMA